METVKTSNDDADRRETSQQPSDASSRSNGESSSKHRHRHKHKKRRRKEDGGEQPAKRARADGLEEGEEADSAVLRSSPRRDDKDHRSRGDSPQRRRDAERVEQERREYERRRRDDERRRRDDEARRRQNGRGGYDERRGARGVRFDPRQERWPERERKSETELRAEEEKLRQVEKKEEEQYKEKVAEAFAKQELSAEEIIEQRRRERQALAERLAREAAEKESKEDKKEDKKEEKEEEEKPVEAMIVDEEKKEEQVDERKEMKEQSRQDQQDATASTAASEQQAEDDAEESDMFADDDDMFSTSPVTNVKKSSTDVNKPPVRTEDDWDDPDGYYRHQVGEVIGGRFNVIGVFGKGVFSTVLKAVDTQRNNVHVALKLIRNNETMAKAGALEAAVLARLAMNDPEAKRHCVRMLAKLEHRNHLVLAFDAMSMNLRSVVHKYGKSVGINISAVRVYARQLLTALRHLERCGVVHADIKPDNIIVNETKTAVQLCDFGSAFYVSEPMEPTPMLVSRFYRAPDVIMGIAYGHPLDMWSIGCVLSEIFTGKLIFPGNDNSGMIKLFLDYCGPFPKKTLKKAVFGSVYFDDAGYFLQKQLDKTVGRTLVKKVKVLKPNRDLLSFISSSGYSKEDRQAVMMLKELLTQIFTLDPSKRITPTTALNHRFCKKSAK